MNTNKITDLHIQISKEDLKILDLLLKANEYSNIVFYCENDEEHFIFTEVKLGRDFYINKGENVEKIYEEYSNFKDANIDKKELFARIIQEKK